MIGSGEVLARLRLVQGRSDSELREFISARGQGLLTIGADATCDWRVQEAGVAPVHFSLHWDGTVLRVSDTHGAGSLRVDGILLGREWRSLPMRARIEFGRAAIVVEMWSESPDLNGHAPRTQRSTVREVPAIQDRGAPPFPGLSAQAARESRTPQVPDLSSRVAHGVATYRAPSTPSQPAPRAPFSSHPREPGHAADVTTSYDMAFASDSSSSSSIAYRGSASSSGLPFHTQTDDATSSSQPGRIPHAVVVLSPLHTQTPEAGPNAERAPTKSFRPSARPLASGRAITIGILAFGVGYASWLYLLYHL